MQLYIVIQVEVITVPMEVLHYLAILPETIILQLVDKLCYVIQQATAMLPLVIQHFFQIQPVVIIAPMEAFHYLLIPLEITIQL